MDAILQAIVPADDKYQSMYAIYQACLDADINPPSEVVEFFGSSVPSPDGLIVDLNARRVCDGDAGYEYLEVSIADLPPGTKAIRAFVTY